jgi:hypothetical protein
LPQEQSPSAVEQLLEPSQETVPPNLQFAVAVHWDFSWPAAGFFAAGTGAGLAREERKALSVGTSRDGPAAATGGDMRKPRAARARETTKTVLFMTNLLSRMKLLSRKPPRSAEYSIFLITDIATAAGGHAKDEDSKKGSAAGPLDRDRPRRSQTGQPLNLQRQVTVQVERLQEKTKGQGEQSDAQRVRSSVQFRSQGQRGHEVVMPSQVTAPR